MRVSDVAAAIIAYFAAFLNRIGNMKTKVGDWKDLFWETAYHQKGD